MKNVIAGALLLVLLSGCQSTSEEETAQATANEKVATKDLTDAELEKIAKNNNVSKAQMKSAAEKLGYSCKLVGKTGSHMKRKICSTKQQREIRAEATKQMLAEMKRKSTGVLDNRG